MYTEVYGDPHVRCWLFHSIRDLYNLGEYVTSRTTVPFLLLAICTGVTGCSKQEAPPLPPPPAADVAAAPTPAVQAAAPANPSAETLAPIPFPADKIRAATSVGRTYVFKVKEGDAEPVLRQMRFTAVSETGGTMEASLRKLTGEALGEPSSENFTWAELEGHAHFPANATVVSQTSLTSALGTHPCTLYVVTQPEGDHTPMVVSYWFATDLPGAPIRVESKSGETVVMTMEMVEHKAGG